jgi:benzodiazapine receptor
MEHAHGRVSMKNGLRLIVSVVTPVLVGALSGMATARGVQEWYPSLVKPSFNPPNWVFGPVWTTLYIMMGIALYLVWRKGLREPGVWAAMVVFAIQLVLNGLWSLLFFGMHRPDIAFFEIVLLWVAILATTIAFFRQHRLAGTLLVPYLAWVSFAAVLNYSLWRLNA